MAVLGLGWGFCYTYVCVCVCDVCGGLSNENKEEGT